MDENKTMQESRMKLHIERQTDWGRGLRIIETKEFDTNIYSAAIGMALRYCHDMKCDTINIRLIDD